MGVNITVNNNTGDTVINVQMRYRSAASFTGGGTGSGSWGLIGPTTIAAYSSQSYVISDYDWQYTMPLTHRAIVVDGSTMSEEVVPETNLGPIIFNIAAPLPENCTATVTVHNTKLYPILVDFVRHTPEVAGVGPFEEILKQVIIQPGESDFYTLIEPNDGEGNCIDTGLELRAYIVNGQINEDLEYEESRDFETTPLEDEGEDTPIIVNASDLPEWEIDAENTVTNGPIDWGTTSTEVGSIQGGFSANLRYQTSQDVVKNALLTAIKTNTANLNARTNTFASIEAAAAAASDFGDDVADGADTVTLGTGISGSIPAMTVSIGGESVDLNPFSVPLIATFSSGIRTFIIWLSSVVFAVGLVRELKIYIAIAVLAPQASAASSSPVVSSFSALAMAAATVTLVGSAIVVLVTYITTTAGYAAAMASPFGGGTLGNAAVLFDNICPVAHLLGLVVAWFVFQFTAGGIATAAALSVRFFVGCMFFGLFVS